MFFTKKTAEVDTQKVENFASWFIENEGKIRFSLENRTDDRSVLVDAVEQQLALIYRDGFKGNIEFDYGGKGTEWELNLYHLNDPFLVNATKKIQLELDNRDLPFWIVNCRP